MAQSKTCRRCGLRKALSEYNRNSKMRDGRGSYCRPCCADYEKERRATKGDQLRARDKARRASKPSQPADPDQVKQCTKCDQVKPQTEFHANRSLRDGRASECKQCHAVYNSEWKRANRNRIRLGLYGLSEADYLELFELQDGKCWICSIDLTEGATPHIDHNHLTRQVRGLLCPDCNWGLGAFGDDMLRLRRAARYLLNPPALQLTSKELTR